MNSEWSIVVIKCIIVAICYVFGKQGRMKRKNKNNGSTSDQRIARIAFRLHGQELSQIQDVQEMLSLNSELDAVRYLMRRGLEAMSATLASRQASKKMQAQVSTEAIVREMIKAGFTPEEAKK